MGAAGSRVAGHALPSPLPPPLTLSGSRRVLQAAAQPAAGREGGSGGLRRRRERVTFVLPGQQVIVASDVTQHALDRVLTATGAIGFEAPDGTVSMLVDNLPEGGTVKVVVPAWLGEPVATQARNLTRLSDNDTRGKELELEAFLRIQASADVPGARLTTLQTAPFTGVAGQDYVRIDACVVAGDTAYVGEYKRVLKEEHLDDLAMKLSRIRGAVLRGRSPDLAAALEGVVHIKLFLGGQAVEPGLAVSELAQQAALVGACLVLPSGQALGLASEPAPALQL